MMNTCMIGGCGEVHKAHGLCRSHYDAAYRNGEPMPRANCETFQMGKDAENKVRMLLAHRGRKVKKQRHPHAPFDLLVDGWKVDVKCARPYMSDARPIPTWEFRLRDEHKEEIADFYVLRLENVPFTDAPIHLLLLAPYVKLIVWVSFRTLLSTHAQFAADFQGFVDGKYGEAAHG